MSIRSARRWTRRARPLCGVLESSLSPFARRPLHLCQCGPQRRDTARRMVFNADGDAHVAVAAGVSGPIAREYAVPLHCDDELLVPCADIEQNEIGNAGPGAHAE